MLSPGLWFDSISEVTLLLQVNFYSFFKISTNAVPRTLAWVFMKWLYFNRWTSIFLKRHVAGFHWSLSVWIIYLIICIHCNQLYNTICQNTNISISNHTMVAVVLYVMRVLVFNYGVIDPNPKQCEDPDWNWVDALVGTAEKYFGCFSGPSAGYFPGIWAGVRGAVSAKT